MAAKLVLVLALAVLAVVASAANPQRPKVAAAGNPDQITSLPLWVRPSSTQAPP